MIYLNQSIFVIYINCLGFSHRYVGNPFSSLEDIRRKEQESIEKNNGEYPDNSDEEAEIQENDTGTLILMLFLLGLY